MNVISKPVNINGKVGVCVKEIVLPDPHDEEQEDLITYMGKKDIGRTTCLLKGTEEF